MLGPCENETGSRSDDIPSSCHSVEMAHVPPRWHNAPVTRPVVLVVGRNIDKAEPGKGLRTPGHGAGHRYSESIVRAGGVPLILPPLPELIDGLDALLDRCDGVVLHGGGDIDPRRYGQEKEFDEVYGVDSDHDDVELALASRVVARDVPLLAICRGLQVLNVALGGTLVQHVDGHVRTVHGVRLEPGSRTAAAMGTERPSECHSYHHQVLDRVASGLDVVGRADDGLIEAAEVRDARWMIGVQWHPEDSAEVDPVQQRLFASLIDVAGHRD